MPRRVVEPKGLRDCEGDLSPTYLFWGRLRMREGGGEVAEAQWGQAAVRQSAVRQAMHDTCHTVLCTVWHVP
jgi:hypothetical protein